MGIDEDLGAKLDVLVRLLALQVIGERTGAEAINVLARAGMDNETIASLIGTSPATVRSARSRARRTEGKH